MTPPSDYYCSIVEPDLVIPDGAVVEWAYPRQIRSNVLVEAGGKLTIRCDVGLPADAVITVEPEGQLIVDGARLYNNCDGDHWQGIVVQGDANYPTQDYDLYEQTYHQGYLSLRTESVIEHAKTGVECQPGGIVHASGTDFLNCLNRGVLISNYQNHYINNLSLPKANSCHFASCKFVADYWGYAGTMASDFQQMVSLRNVDGVRFTGCKFINEADASLQNEHKQGIYAFNAGFSVGGKCNDNSLPCTSYTNAEFVGFDRGIVAENYFGVRTFSVTNTTFSDNVVGIEAVGVPSALITTNNFEVGCYQDFEVPQGQSVKANRGIMLYKCTGYKVEDNDITEFSGNAADTAVIGILVNTSGEQENEVYRNRLEQLKIGNLSNGKNRHPNVNIIKGLQYLCNTNIDNSLHDISIPKQDGLVGGGIRVHQGSSAKAAGNTFTTPFIGADSALHINNQQNHITYFCSGTGCPTLFTDDNVTLSFGSSNTCPSKLASDKDGKLDPGMKQQFKEDFASTIIGSDAKGYASHMLLRHYLVDTPSVKMDSVRHILKQKGDLLSSFMLVDAWLQEGKDTAAQEALDSIALQFTLTGDTLVEYNLFTTFKSLQLEALQNGDSDEDLVAMYQDTLEYLAEAGHYLASVQAQALLNAVNGFTYTPEVILPKGGGSMAIKVPPIGNVLWTEQYATLEARPNPATGHTVFRYRLPEDVEQGHISVTDLTGRLVATFDLTSGIGNITWDTTGLGEGIYLYSLLTEETCLSTKRLAIIH